MAIPLRFRMINQNFQKYYSFEGIKKNAYDYKIKVNIYIGVIGLTQEQLDSLDLLDRAIT